ncbi:MAG: FAD:protein FMN transferase [Candidatus Delongbacteria bacterium]
MNRLRWLVLFWLAAGAAVAGDPVVWKAPVGAWEARLRVEQPNPARDLAADLAATGAMLERHWSQLRREGAGSEITQVNVLAGQRSGRLSRPNYDAVLRSLQWKDKTRGAVDLLAGPLRRWQAAGGVLPAPDSVLALVRDGGAYFVELGVLLRTPGMELDLDPIADGLLADRALDSLRARGHRGVSVGLGSVWRVTPGDSIRILDDGSAASGAGPWLAGRAWASRPAGGAQLDPRTGRPVESGFRAAVLAPTAEEAAVWATALSLLGWEGLELLNDLPKVDAALAGPGPAGPELRRTAGFPAGTGLDPR